MKHILKILFLVFCSFTIQAQHNEILDSLEHKLTTSEGVERCQQVVKLFRAFENQPDAGGIPFPDNYYTYVDECIPIAEANYETGLLNSLKISKAALLVRQGQDLAVYKLLSEVLASQHSMNLADSMDTYVFLSGIVFNFGLYEKGFELAKVRNRLAKKLNRHDVELHHFTDIAMTYYKLKIYDLASINFKKLVEFYITDSDYYMAASNYNNLGLTYARMHKYDSALYYYNISKVYVNRHYEGSDNPIEKDYFLGLIDGNIGEVYITINQYEKGIELVKKDIWSSIKFGDFGNTVNSLVQLAHAYQLKNDPIAALVYVDSATSILEDKQLMSVNRQIEVGEIRAHLLIDLKQFKKAAHLFHDINLLKDSLQTEENRENALISNSIYQVHQLENDLLDKQANLVESELQHLKDVQLRNILYSITVLLLISVVIGVILRHRRNKDHRLLHIQKQEIESQKKLIESNLDEKELLLKEIQHRVKNNLQVISGMLQLQASNFDDPEACRVMEEGQARIKAMAIIHQQLYQKGDNLKYISFNSYLKDLTNQIAGSYKEISKNVAIEIKAESIQFDVKTAIPLGIIINELISNAFKYAFTEKKEGNINISIQKVELNNYTLIVKDDGIGLPSDFNLNKVNSLGLKLVKILSKQMKGSFDFKNGKGTSFIISFKDNVTV